MATYFFTIISIFLLILLIIILKCVITTINKIDNLNSKINDIDLRTYREFDSIDNELYQIDNMVSNIEDIINGFERKKED